MVLRQPVSGSLLMAWTQLAGKFEIRSGILRYVGFQLLHVLQRESGDVFLFVVVLEGAHDSQQGILRRPLIRSRTVGHDVVRASSCTALSYDRVFH
jgi:hypothetical protein